MGDEGVDDLAIVRLVEELGDGACGDRADAGDARDLAQRHRRTFLAGDAGQFGDTGPVGRQPGQSPAGGRGDAGEGEGQLLVQRRLGPGIGGRQNGRSHDGQGAGGDAMTLGKLGPFG